MLPGDQILEVMSEDLRDVTHSHALHALRQTPNRLAPIACNQWYPHFFLFVDSQLVACECLLTKEFYSRVRLVIHREDDEIYETLEVELLKKKERGLGLSIVGKKSGPGVFISEVSP